MPTPDLFDFDPEGLATYEADHVRRALTEHPAIYVNHLEIAQHVEAWAERLERHPDIIGGHPAFIDGYVEALRALSAHLRQADYTPIGTFLLEERARRCRASGRHLRSGLRHAMGNAPRPRRHLHSLAAARRRALAARFRTRRRCTWSSPPCGGGSER